MYFPLGWPKIFSNFPCQINKGEYTVIKHSPNGELICAANHNTIVVFSGGPSRLFLAALTVLSPPRDQVERGIEEWNVNSPITELLWRSNSSSICALTSSGVIHILELVFSDQKYQPQTKFKKQHLYIYPAFPRRELDIKKKSRLSPVGGCASVCDGAQDSLLLCTKAAVLMRVSWEGTVIEHAPLLSMVRSVYRGNEGIWKIYHSQGCVGALWRNGASCICIPSSTLDSALSKEHRKDNIARDGWRKLYLFNENQFRGMVVWLTKDGACSLAFNSINNVIAVGMIDGSVNLFPFDLENYRSEQSVSNAVEISVKTLQVLRILDYFPASGPDPGAAVHLDWTPDGRALAVGMERRGLVVWSIHGCRLMCTIPQGNFEESIAPVDSRTIELARSDTEADTAVEPFRRGVQGICWGYEGFYLIGTSQGQLIQFDFVKSCVCTTPSCNYSERLLLQGESKILMLSIYNRDLDQFQWQHLNYPHTYVCDNWPIRSIAVSRDGQRIAIAGFRGFAIGNIRTGKWKLFGDQTHEQSILCTGLCWYQDMIIVANEGLDHSESPLYELLFYSSHHLSNNNILARAYLPKNRKPLLLDCNDSNLVVLTHGSFFYQYSLKCLRNKDFEPTSVETNLVHQVSLKRDVANLQAMLLLPSTNGSYAARCLTLSSKGHLSLWHAEKGQQAEIALGVEQFWYGGGTIETANDKDCLLSNSLWAYGKNGLEVWFPFMVDSELATAKLMKRDKSLNFDKEVYPVGFIPEQGVIVGITQGLQFVIPKQVFSFHLNTKTHPFLHSIFRHLLFQGQEDQAWKVAQRYKSVPHFSHSLELLLHEVLEPTIEQDYLKKEKHKEYAQLQLTVEFLRKSPFFPLIVVACARKTDINLWDKLFACCGVPYNLFELCLANYRDKHEAEALEASAAYLRVLLQTDGPERAVDAAIKVLAAALEWNQTSIAANLARFIIDLANDTYTNEEDHANNWSLKLVPKREPNAVMVSVINSPSMSLLSRNLAQSSLDTVDSLLARHARKLMLRLEMKELVRFAREVGGNLTKWFEKEKNRAANIEDLPRALQVIHLQFELSNPSIFPPSKRNDLAEFWRSRKEKPGNPYETSFEQRNGNGTHPMTPISSKPNKQRSPTPTTPNVAQTAHARTPKEKTEKPNTNGNSNSNASRRISLPQSPLLEEFELPIEESFTSPTAAFFPQLGNVSASSSLTSPRKKMQRDSGTATPYSPNRQISPKTPLSQSSSKILRVTSLTKFSHREITGKGDSEETMDETKRDLFDLLDAAYGSGCLEWTLVFAIALMEATVIVEVLSAQPVLWPHFQSALDSIPCPGYSELRALVAQTIATDETLC